MISKRLHIILLTFFMLFSAKAFAQEQDVKVELGKNTLLPNENFTIKIIIKNSSTWEVSQLPEIEGFKMTGKSVAHTPYVEKGQKGFVHIITQNYSPIKSGVFKLNKTSIKVNNQLVDIKNETLMVLQEDGSFNDESNINENIREDALLLLSINKKSVFVGEGYRLSLAFYVAETNLAEMKFGNDIEAQIEAIAKKIKPNDCLESRLEIKELSPISTSINNKSYKKYTLFEAIYYPLNNKTIQIPAVGVNMIVLLPNKKIANSRIQTLKYFAARPASIIVKNLPEHPLKTKVPVGVFKLDEQIDSKIIKTGKSFTYTFKIGGEGNVNTISLSEPINDKHFDFYVPEIHDHIISGNLSGERSFKYRIIPKDSGNFKLDSYFSLIFFNTENAKYDTLKSKIAVAVKGKTISNSSETNIDIYHNIEQFSSIENEVDYRDVIKNIANIAIIIMLASIILLFGITKKNNN